MNFHLKIFPDKFYPTKACPVCHDSINVSLFKDLLRDKKIKCTACHSSLQIRLRDKMMIVVITSSILSLIACLFVKSQIIRVLIYSMIYKISMFFASKYGSLYKIEDDFIDP